MISIKMIDGSRYDTTDAVVVRADNWVMIRTEEKVIRLNPAHIVSITERRENG